MRTSSTPVQAGSMADIAFLLLIFFLTTTTISSDAGIHQKLPEHCPSADCGTSIIEQHILSITINAEDQLMA